MPEGGTGGSGATAEQLAQIEQNTEDIAELKGVLADIFAGRPHIDTLEDFFNLQRDGKLYQTKIWKFASNPTSAGEKLLDNAGLKFEPSTDTVAGADDYADIPLFQWWHCNYIREDNCDVTITAIEGDDNYATTGAVDVGAMGMTFYWKFDTSNPDYDLITISDSPNHAMGLQPWVESIRADGTVAPYWCHSAYLSVLASDGLLRSQPGGKIARNQSYNNMIANYQNKGAGYWGAGACRNTFQIIFNLIMGATKSSQTLYSGVTNWNFQYDAAVQRDADDTYFPVTATQANGLEVGCCVSIGYASNNNGNLNKDRSVASIHSYADDVKILRIEDMDDGNKAVYLDVDQGFNTTPVALTDTLSSPIIMTSMHMQTGETDAVCGRHNGSAVSNTNSQHPYRVQGTEYALGAYIVASDTVMDFQTDYSKNVYVAPKGVAHSSADATIRGAYTLVGNIPSANDGADWYVGDVAIHATSGAWHPSAAGSGSTQGYGDNVYAGSKATSGTREYLQGGYLRSGPLAGSACLDCWGGLGAAGWNCASAD